MFSLDISVKLLETILLDKMPGFGCQLIAAAAFLADFINPASAKVDFDTPFRPQVHFSPPQNWLGRPCGAFRDSSATWHVYYLRKSTYLFSKAPMIRKERIE